MQVGDRGLGWEVEVLHLFRHIAPRSRGEYSASFTASCKQWSRDARTWVRHEVLVLVHFSFSSLYFDEAAIDGILRGLPIMRSDLVGNMLRRDFELAADVVFDQFAERRFSSLSLMR